MQRPLSGRAILIIEDEVLVALDIQQALEEQGAETTTARTVAAALLAIEDPTFPLPSWTMPSGMGIALSCVNG